MGHQVKAHLVKYCPMCGAAAPTCHKGGLTHFVCQCCNSSFEVNDFIQRAQAKIANPMRRDKAEAAYARYVVNRTQAGQEVISFDAWIKNKHIAIR